MAKKVLTLIKLQIPGGQANPAPPVGPALGQHGVNIMEFCKAFNAQTQQENGRITPVEITVYEDRSFTFITKTPPAAVLIKEALNIQKGSPEPNREKVGRLSRDQLRKIAETKLVDLNARDVDHAMLVVAGTARSMGVLGGVGGGVWAAAPGAPISNCRLVNAARSAPWAPAWEGEVDRLDALRRWQLVQDRADDPLNVVLVMPEIVQERLERAVGELELRRGELEAIGDLVRLDQTDVVVGHDCS